jgi:hypothetical protein
MKFNLKSLLKEKSVLYITLFFTITNLFGYLMMNNFKAIIFFLITGIISSYFSKNMIVIMFGSLLITNFFVVMTSYFGNTSNKNKEGFEVEGDKDKKEQEEEKANTTTSDTKNTTAAESSSTKPTATTKPTSKPGSPKPTSADDVVGVYSETPSINFSSTLEKAYDNLQKFLSSDAINKMSDDTQRLAEKQSLLMNNIDKLAPIMKTAEDLLGKLNLDKMGNMGDMINSMKDKLANVGK